MLKGTPGSSGLSGRVTLTCAGVAAQALFETIMLEIMRRGASSFAAWRSGVVIIEFIVPRACDLGQESTKRQQLHPCYT